MKKRKIQIQVQVPSSHQPQLSSTRQNFNQSGLKIQQTSLGIRSETQYGNDITPINIPPLYKPILQRNPTFIDHSIPQNSFIMY